MDEAEPKTTMSVIFGMSWKDPAVLFVLAVVAFGGTAMYLEVTAPVGVWGAETAVRGPAGFALGMFALLFWARLILNLIAIPEECLPKVSLTFDLQLYKRRQRVVQYFGYGCGAVTMLLSFYKIVLLARYL